MALTILCQISLACAIDITNTHPSNQEFNISNSIEINSTITDSDGISIAYVNITYPNNTIQKISLSSQTGDKYNATFTIPNLPGEYDILIWANDTLGNSQSETHNLTAQFSSPLNILDIRLWVDASDNSTLYTDSSCTTQVTSNGDEVLCWENKAGETNVTVLSGKSGAKYISNNTERINGLTNLRFNKSNESVYETGLDIRANTTEDLTIFTVYRPRTTDTSDQGQAIWGNDDGGWDRFYYSLFSYSASLGTDGVDDGLISLGGASSGLSIDGAGIVDTIFLLTAIYNGQVTGGTNSGPTNGSGIYFDGELQVEFTDESHATAAQTQIFIGRDGDNGYYDGDLVEMIVYDKVFDACELEIVNKHLSSKYGKDFFGITDNYGYGSPHNNDINGISEINGNCTTTVEITSGTSSIATISSPTDLDLDDSLTFAHDAEPLTTIKESPAGYESRINRTWRVDEDNEVGNVSVSFDMSSTTVSTTSSDFALIIDTDTNFSDATTHTTGFSTEGETITFTDVNLSDGEYFTLAVRQNAPNIEFTSPTPSNNTVQNEDHFTINMSSTASGDDHYSFINFDNSLLLWLRMDTTNSSGHPTDVSGNDNNGELQGDALINSTGRFGDAAHFDGSGDFINLPASNSLVENQAAWTTSIWFNAKSISSSSLGNRLLTLRNTSTLSATAFALGNNNQLQFFYRNEAGTGITTNITTITTDTWYHYAVTYNNSASKIYINGVLNSTIHDTITGTSDHTARIGANPSGSSEFFNGSIDELIIMNHELPSHEIAALYNATANQFFGNTTTLSEGNHTFTGYTVGKNGKQNQTEPRIITIDLTAPSITSLNVTPDTSYTLSEIIQINATVTDSIEVDSVKANITFPNGTIIQINLPLSQSNNYNNTYTAPGILGNFTVTLITNDTAGNINSTETDEFKINNSIPIPSSTSINSGSDLTLTAGDNKTVIGSATITDLNGYSDIQSVKGHFYLTEIGLSAQDNRTNHYTTTCSSNGDGSGNTESYDCTFEVAHYATPTDSGSNKSSTDWTFQISPLDDQDTGNNDTDNIEVNTLSSFSISPSTINFGSLNLGANTTDENKIINVTNSGNVGIDILLSGTNLSCSLGIVPVNFLEYEDNPFEYGIGIDLLESSVELDLDALPGSQNNENPIKQTYYGLSVPSSSVGGSCSGTIVLTGQSDPHND